jgi:hypothetical protein
MTIYITRRSLLAGGGIKNFLNFSVVKHQSSESEAVPQKPLSSLWNVTRSTRPAKTSVGLSFAAIDCLTRSSPEHLSLSIFFHNRDRPCFNPAMSSISEGFVLRKVTHFAAAMGLNHATIANLPHCASLPKHRRRVSLCRGRHSRWS